MGVVHVPEERIMRSRVVGRSRLPGLGDTTYFSCRVCEQVWSINLDSLHLERR